MLPSKILIGISSSVSLYKALDLCSKLKKQGCNIRVVMTEKASRLISPTLFEALTRNEVFVAGEKSSMTMPHIELARWADLYLIYPATAKTLAHLSLGIGDDLLTDIHLAASPKVVTFVTPAMNSEMWNNPSVQEHIIRLKSKNVRVIDPAEGNLACGEYGVGKLNDVETTLEILEKHYSAISKQVLITAGGTREYIDAVRYITNKSTGKTGKQLALAMSKMGWKVTLVSSNLTETDEVDLCGVQTYSYETTMDLENCLNRLSQETHYDLVVQAAAISDYTIHQISTSGTKLDFSKGDKISSEFNTLHLQLSQNTKLLSKFPLWFSSRTKVVAFKLVPQGIHSESTSAAQKLLKAYDHVHAVVQNSLDQMHDMDRTFKIINRSQEESAIQGVSSLARKILQSIGESES